MGELQYSIFRYAPSLVSGEKINLAAVFYYETGYREFFSVSKWNRVLAFDDTLNIPLLKALMKDIKDEVEASLHNPDFNLIHFCQQYDSEFHFDKCESIFIVSEAELSAQIEEIQRMYFQFEFDVKRRPMRKDQRRFLCKLLESKQIKYVKEPKKCGNYDAEIKYDYTFNDFGVVFFDFNGKKIDNKTMNKVKAWAWNAQNSKDNLKLLILYDLADERRTDVRPALEILRSVTNQAINIHDGFSDVLQLIS